MQVSSYLIITLIASWKESELPCAVGEKKTRFECMTRRRLNNSAMLPQTIDKYNTDHQALTYATTKEGRRDLRRTLVGTWNTMERRFTLQNNPQWQKRQLTSYL